MATQAGQKIQFADFGVEVIVTTPGDADVTAAPAEGDEELQIGKRYQCETTGTQVLVVKPGGASLWCGDNKMTMMQPKKVAASD